MIYKKNLFLFSYILSTFFFVSHSITAQPASFKQPVSVKFQFSDRMKNSILKKVVIDYNDRVYVLTDKALYRVTGKKITKDLLYRPLADKTPVDITTQEKTGYLYYLYKNSFLSNTQAGLPYGKIPEGVYNQIAVSSGSKILLTGPKKAALYSNMKGKIRDITLPKDSIINIQSYKGTFYALTGSGVYVLKQNHFARI